MPGRWNIYPEMAAAGLWTTAGDLARIGCAFLRTLQGDHSPFGLSRESATEMLTALRAGLSNAPKRSI